MFSLNETPVEISKRESIPTSNPSPPATPPSSPSPVILAPTPIRFKLQHRDITTLIGISGTQMTPRIYLLHRRSQITMHRPSNPSRLRSSCTIADLPPHNFLVARRASCAIEDTDSADDSADGCDSPNTPPTSPATSEAELDAAFATLRLRTEALTGTPAGYLRRRTISAAAAPALDDYEGIKLAPSVLTRSRSNSWADEVDEEMPLSSTSSAQPRDRQNTEVVLSDEDLFPGINSDDSLSDVSDVVDEELLAKRALYAKMFADYALYNQYYGDEIIESGWSTAWWMTFTCNPTRFGYLRDGELEVRNFPDASL